MTYARVLGEERALRGSLMLQSEGQRAIQRADLAHADNVMLGSCSLSHFIGGLRCFFLAVTAEWVSQVECEDQWWMTSWVSLTCVEALPTYRKLHSMGWGIVAACALGTAGYLFFSCWAPTGPAHLQVFDKLEEWYRTSWLKAHARATGVVMIGCGVALTVTSFLTGWDLMSKIGGGVIGLGGIFLSLPQQS